MKEKINKLIDDINADVEILAEKLQELEGLIDDTDTAKNYLDIFLDILENERETSLNN